MLSAYESGPGMTGVGQQDALKKENSIRNSRESVGILFLVLISVAVLFSSICIFKYALRDRAVYDELVDYLDKTVSISKINYNPMLGLYELTAGELEGLNEQRKYKSLIWIFLFADLACLVFFVLSAFFYFSAAGEQSRGIIGILFWLFLSIGALYSLAESTIFAFLLSPYSTKLPNSTISLMDHAIPYNPGGLAQMENRFGCIFDQNLYETTLFKRHQNPRNTCDPFLLSSFISHFLLVSFIFTRLLAILLLVILLLRPNSKISAAITRMVKRMKPAIHYRKNAVDGKGGGRALPPYYSSPTKTTFGVNEPQSPASAHNNHHHRISSPLPTQIPPITPPIGQMDHTISYNNAALFAISGAVPHSNFGMQSSGSSRCSEISAVKCVAATDMALRGSTHTTNSLVSEV